MPIAEKNKDGGIVNKFYFCFPIDLQLVFRENAQDWPVIHMEIYSKDFWDRIYMHGCGFVTIPYYPGSHIIEIETWKPTIDLRTRISEFFLGGLIRAKNIEEISKTEKEDGMVNVH